MENSDGFKANPKKLVFLFGWDKFYPDGGFNDWIGSYSTVDEARADMVRQFNSSGGYQIVDVINGNVEDYWSDDHGNLRKEGTREIIRKTGNG